MTGGQEGSPGGLSHTAHKGDRPRWAGDASRRPLPSLSRAAVKSPGDTPRATLVLCALYRGVPSVSSAGWASLCLALRPRLSARALTATREKKQSQERGTRRRHRSLHETPEITTNDAAPPVGFRG